ncbi:MAG: hypothetical protein FJ404_10470 [Verrucomicrobia bacterium]|nr:hypothetical protein [Verrucomicrobiota bacterium]
MKLGAAGGVLSSRGAWGWLARVGGCRRWGAWWCGSWILAWAVQAEEWPQFLGPRRDGSSTVVLEPERWPEGGPPLHWKKKVGQGFSSPIAAKGRVWLHHRLEGKEVVECWEAATGKREWIQSVEATYRDDHGFEEGPRATPALEGDDLATLGADGELQLLSARTGEVRWRKSARRDFGAGKGFFGFASSPLFTGGQVVFCLGGASGAGLVSLDRQSGVVVWKADVGEAGYASPVFAGEGESRRIACFNRSGLHWVEPGRGDVLARFSWRARNPASVNAATPLVAGSHVFITASYETGAAWLKWPEGGRGDFKVSWSGDESLSAHYATPVLHQGHLYGFHGRQEQGAALRCVEAGTGRVLWESERFGNGTLIRTPGHLMILHERGELVVAPLKSDRFKPVRRFQMLGSGVRAGLAVTEKWMFARSLTEMVALPLRVP